MLGKKELQERLTQRESALAQREAEIAVLTRRVEELMAQESRLHAELDGYRSRKEAIVNALMESQRTATRIREEADAYKAQVVGGAYFERDAAKREAEESLRKARQQAEQILAEAQDRAAVIRAQAEEQGARRQAQADQYLAEAQQKAEGLKERLRQAAEEARQQAAAFGSFVMDIGNAGAGPGSAPGAALPQDYRSPAELMQNIYVLQGRELPREDAAPKAVEAAAPAPAQKPAQAAAPDMDALFAELMNTLDGPKEKEEPAQEQVFSVEEIMAAAGAPDTGVCAKAGNVPSDLDAIIDDILRGI